VAAPGWILSCPVGPGRARARGHRWDAHIRRPPRCRPAVQLRQAPQHGMNLQVIASPHGEILWVSGALPGSVYDLTAARIWGIVRRLAAAGLIVLAGRGYTGAGEPVITSTGGGTSHPRKSRQPRPRPARRSRRASQRPAHQDPDTSCASCAATHGAPGSSPKPSTSFKPARSPDEERSVP
jgi:DDE superfamily endonuclease